MKRSTKSALSLLMLCLAPQAMAASGGSLVGNGAGLAEIEITYTYAVRLPEAISDCLTYRNCGLDAREESVLNEIVGIINTQPDPERKLSFLSETEAPGFFSTGEG